MAGRSQLPLMAMSALGIIAASTGLGYGLGQYTVTGMDPYALVPAQSGYDPNQAGRSDDTQLASARGFSASVGAFDGSN